MDHLARSAVRRAQAALSVVSDDRGTEFSLGAMLRSLVSDDWYKSRSRERTVCDDLARRFGEPAGHGIRVPDDVLQVRDLQAGTGSAGGFLTATRVRGYISALQPVSAAVSLGATIETVPAGGGVAVPRGTAAVATTWLANETATITETAPTFGQIVLQPKILSAFCEVSRQLLLQSNAENVIRLEFASAAGAALDAAILNGSGASGQPTGIINTAGVGSFTGVSLSQGALRNAQADVSTATAVNAATCGYVSTPAVAELLATRLRTASTDSRMLWEGPSAAGTVEGCRAIATSGCPSGTAIYGDWSRLTVLQWDGGLVIEADPYTKFSSGIVAVRMLLPVDVIVTAPAAFSVATSIS
jgi:HK97 family phage major capsid protein